MPQNTMKEQRRHKACAKITLDLYKDDIRLVLVLVKRWHWLSVCIVYFVYKIAATKEKWNTIVYTIHTIYICT